MTIELPGEIETQWQETAGAQGLSVGEYVERLVTETNLRTLQLSEFRAAIAERMASLNAGDNMGGEEVMPAYVEGDLREIRDHIAKDSADSAWHMMDSFLAVLHAARDVPAVINRRAQ